MDFYKNKMRQSGSKNKINKRKEIVEHPFGTIKRSFGYTYFIQRGMEKVKLYGLTPVAS